MSEKRTSPESSRDEQTTTEGSDAKRAKLCTLNDTTLQDLPYEMVECILVRAVVMEVRDPKLVKVMWKEKADPAMDRLQTVCSQWSSILTNNVFRNEVYKILDVTAQKTIHLETVISFPVNFFVFKVAALKEEIFFLSRPNGCRDGQGYVINVCAQQLALTVKDVIRLPDIQLPWDIAACSVSNCIYVVYVGELSSSVLRITKDGGYPYKLSLWITTRRLSFPILSVSTNGSLVIISRPIDPNMYTSDIYGSNGTLQRKLLLFKDTYDFRWLQNAMLKPNGNLLLASTGDRRGIQITEIDTIGRIYIVRNYRSQSFGFADVAFADAYRRIWITDWRKEIELLDSELNKFKFTGSQLLDNYSCVVSCNSDRSEIVRVSYATMYKDPILTIFRLAVKCSSDES